MYGAYNEGELSPSISLYLQPKWQAEPYHVLYLQ